MTATTPTTNPADAVTPVPDGMIRTTDLLDVIREHAARNDWCRTVEGLLGDYFALRFQSTGPVVTPLDGCPCPSCTHARESDGKTYPRFTPVGGPEFLSRDVVATALTRATAGYGNLAGFTDDLSSRFGITVDQGRTYVITVVVTDRDLKTMGEDGVAKRINDGDTDWHDALYEGRFRSVRARVRPVKAD